MWSRSYQAALRRYVHRGPTASLRSAARLGRQAVELGLETLDVARFHEQALMTLASLNGSSGTGQARTRRAKRFFAETIVPIEKTHRAALKAGVCVKRLTQTLCRRTMKSHAADRRLAQVIARREAAEALLERSGKRREKLLQRSNLLQGRVRDRARKAMSKQEDERGKISRLLHDDIAQTLLALHIRLLTFRKSAKADMGSIKKRIAKTQQVVDNAARTVGRLGHEPDIHHET